MLLAYLWQLVVATLTMFGITTTDDVSVESDGNTVTIKAGKCEQFEDFPVEAGDKSAEEEGHYTWDGSDLTLVEGEDAIKAHEKLCEAGPEEDPTCRS